MDTRSRYDDLDEAVTTAVEAKLAELHTAIPCTVVSVDFKKQTAVLQPTVKARIIKPDGSADWLAMPQLPDVPLHFPSGGGVTMTFPVKAGDEALVVMSSRNQDAWQQSGGEQQQVEYRNHDLSNGFALVGFKSNPKALENVSSESTQVRSDDGKHVVDIHPSNGLTLSSSKGVTLKCGDHTMAMTSAGTEFTGGYVKSDGKPIDATHIHGGVVPGGANTDVPVG